MQHTTKKGLPKKSRDKLLNILVVLSLFFTLQLSAQSPTVNMQLRSRLSLGGPDGSNICGYAANGREYALVGNSSGTMIVDVTNPDAPKTLRQIPGVQSIWREIKVYRNYAYITTDNNGPGLQIVDLSRLPDTTGMNARLFKSDTTRGLLNILRTHALHIDTAKGFCYLFGGGYTLSTLSGNACIVLDIKTDPLNPRYVGAAPQPYIHDGFVENDTLYAGNIFNGYFSIIDFRDKANPIVLSTTTTPTAFTHNTWRTSDRKAVLTTDENCGSYLGSFDVSNPQQPKFLDRIRSISEGNAVVHNTHILNDYAVTSWYTEGVIVTDAHRPQNLVHVAQYDAFNGTLPDYEGTWGVYPFLPSGNLLLSNITPGELVIVTPQYKRACYLEGTIKDANTNQVLSGVRVKINSTDMDKHAESGITGKYATGQVTAGNFTVTYSKKGYASQIIAVNLATAGVTNQDISLRPAVSYTVSGNVSAVTGGAALADIQAVFKSDYETFSTKTNAQGLFSTAIPEADYDVYLGEWGVQSRYMNKRTITANGTTFTAALQRAYIDDFWGDFGWKVTGNATSGAWTRGIPEAVSDVVLTQSGNDSPTDNDNFCFFTANGNCDGGPGAADVDGGATILTSKPMKIRNYADPQLTFNYWFYNGGGNTALNDTFTVILSNGLKDTTIMAMRTSGSTWRQSPVFKVKNYLPLTDSMTVAFRVADADPGHVVEGAVDNFRLIDLALPNAVQDIANNWTVKAFPNPFNTALNIDYQLDKDAKNATIKVINTLGQVLEAQNLKNTEGSLSLGLGLPTGVYFIKIEANGKASRAVRVVKQ
jgi:choice-of-anchor B domain-containing protein